MILDQRRARTKDGLRDHFKRLLADKLSPEQLAGIQALPVRTTAEPRRTSNGPGSEQVWRTNPLNIQATKESTV